MHLNLTVDIVPPRVNMDCPVIFVITEFDGIFESLELKAGADPTFLSFQDDSAAFALEKDCPHFRSLSATVLCMKPLS